MIESNARIMKQNAKEYMNDDNTLLKYSQPGSGKVSASDTKMYTFSCK